MNPEVRGSVGELLPAERFEQLQANRAVLTEVIKALEGQGA
jgi:DNA-binding FadR family transcriptional regulator